MHDRLTVRKFWVTCTETDLKHVTRRVKLNAHLGELVHRITVEHALEHEVICGSKPTCEKYEKGKTATEQQPSRASGCEAATSS
jgi:hypothetical protein